MRRKTEQSSPSAEPRRRLVPLASLMLLTWVGLGGGMYLMFADTPDPPAVDEREQAIRARMAEWAVRDAEQWTEASGDQTVPWTEARGHLAIVIDDTGRELELFEKLLALRYPLSFSVLPHSTYAPGVQQRLEADDRRPREILLHIPMEPLDPDAMDGVDANEHFLLASDSPEQLQAKVREAIARVPAATGVNNHMGSRLTADHEAMASIMPLLREHGLYFLDSRTHPETVAAEEADAAGLAAISRKVFLDHDPSPAAIRAALYEAAAESRQHPTVAIAHPSIELVEVLREELPRLREQGVGIYPVSRIIAGTHVQ